MESNLLIKLGKLASIPGIALGIMLILLKNILVTKVFSTLPPEQASNILLLIAIGSFIIGALGIVSWTLGRRKQYLKTTVRASDGSVAFGNNARNNTVSVNKLTRDEERR